MMTETLGVEEKPHPDSVTSGSPTGGAQHDSNIMTAQMLSMMPLPYTHTTPSSSTRPSSSIRPYKCDVCHRSFREVATLRKHEQLHRADRPYVCTTCSKSFLWSSNLKVHERVHTGERPYTCGICQRRFTQSNDLRRHERNVHMHHKQHHHSRGGGGSSGNSPSHPSQQHHHHKSHGSSSTPSSSSSMDGAIGSTGGSTSPQSTTMALPPVSSAVAAVSSHLATSGQVNMAAYQALALQQRAALLQQAMAYESMMQSAAGVSPTVSSSMLPHSTAVMSAPVLTHLSPPVRHSLMSSAESAPISSTSHFIKTEQITPPPTPISIMLGSGKTTALPPIEQLRGSVSGGCAAVSTTGHLIALPMPFIQSAMPRSASVHSNESSSLPPTLSPSPTIQSPPISQSSALAMAAQFGVKALTSPPNLVSQFSSGIHHVTGLSPTYGLTLPQAHQNQHNVVSSYGKPDSSGENGVDLRTNKSTAHHHHHHHDHHLGSDHSEEEIMEADDDAEIQRSSKYGKGSPKEDNSNSTSPSSKSSSKDNSQSSDAEGDEKRDVTTTSGYPTGLDGFFRCVHCDVYFREFTMYHLHQSLHIPDADDPFICPSCGKRCADRIEFTFHLVWHVRYPHTIPNYQPFHSSYIMGCSSNC